MKPITVKNPANLKPHPVAELFPMIGDQWSEERAWLSSSIESEGLFEPIVLHDGLVVDGRNRLKICLEVGAEPHFVEYDGDTDDHALTAFVFMKNAARRHLTQDQIAAAGVKADKLIKEARAKEKRRESGRVHGRGRKKVEENSPQPKSKPNATRKAIAKQRGTTEHKVRQATDVQNHLGDAALDEVLSGKRKLKDVAQVAKKVAAASKPKARERRPRLKMGAALKDELGRAICKQYAAWAKESRQGCIPDDEFKALLIAKANEMFPDLADLTRTVNNALAVLSPVKEARQ